MCPLIFSEDDVKLLLKTLNLKSFDKGLEYHSFKIGWYNDCVQKQFKFPLEADTLAVVVISTPQMFENLILPYIKKKGLDIDIRDPVDACISQHLAQIKEELGPHYDIEVLHDFDLTPTRRPKILVQTAAHVAGAAYYYQRSDVENDPWGEKKKINGVCMHPKYGGWFAMRGVSIFKNLVCPQLQRVLPVDCVPSRDQRIMLLDKFNFCWQDWSFRDVIEVESKYSHLQKLYFETKPCDRRRLLNEWVIT